MYRTYFVSIRKLSGEYDYDTVRVFIDPDKDYDDGSQLICDIKNGMGILGFYDIISISDITVPKQ